MTKEKIMGIYQIRNLINGKVYIGSSIDIDKRWKKHVRELKNLIHPNQHLQSSWNKYGEESFIFEMIEDVCDDKLLLKCEQKYLDNLKKDDYNMVRDARGGSRGRFVSDETRKRMSDSHKGEKCVWWGKRGEESHMWKWNPSIETRKKMSDSHRGKKMSDETREKQTGKNNHNYGKHLSKETRKKLSIANSGERAGSAKLKLKDVDTARVLYASGQYTYKMLSKMFNVGETCIGDIIRGRTWKMSK